MTRTRALWTLAITICTFPLLSQEAIKGEHVASGNIGYIGTSLYGVRGVSYATNAAGVLGEGFGPAGSYLTGVRGRGYYGVRGEAIDPVGVGVWGTGHNAVEGIATYTGVLGTSTGASGTGLWGFVSAETDTAFAVYGATLSQMAYAGWFDGKVNINGTLTKSAGAFKIDHPVYPAERYLSHSFVESPDMKNIYDGVATLDADGTAVVKLPEWFEALNKDFRYQLTCIGMNAPVFIAEEVSKNEFKIGGGYAEMKVSWQVTGIRRDPYAEAYRIPVEEDKPMNERGRYLHPELYGGTDAHSVTFERKEQVRAMEGRRSTVR